MIKEKYGNYPNFFYTTIRRTVIIIFGRRRRLLKKLKLSRLSNFLELLHLPETLVDYYVAEKLKSQLKNKTHERAVTNYLLSCYGECFVDCGSNLGYYSFLLSGHFHKIIAVEPLPRNIRVMELVGDTDGIKILQMAVSDKNGYAELYFGPHRGGCTLKKNNRGSVRVKLITLDEVLKDIEHAVVKVDVEGHEYEVLNGARQSMCKINNWVIEVHGSYRGLDLNDNEISNFLRSYGYSVHPISDNHIVAERNGSIHC